MIQIIKIKHKSKYKLIKKRLIKSKIEALLKNNNFKIQQSKFLKIYQSKTLINNNNKQSSKKKTNFYQKQP